MHRVVVVRPSSVASVPEQSDTPTSQNVAPMQYSRFRFPAAKVCGSCNPQVPLEHVSALASDDENTSSPSAAPFR